MVQEFISVRLQTVGTAPPQQGAKVEQLTQGRPLVVRVEPHARFECIDCTNDAESAERRTWYAAHSHVTEIERTHPSEAKALSLTYS